MNSYQRCLLIFFLLFAGAACKRNKDELATPSDSDSCMNKISADFDFRKGKWIEILDSFDALYTQPDTIWFRSDSLMAWSVAGDPYIETKMFFWPCSILVHESLPTIPPSQTTWINNNTMFDEKSGILSIIWDWHPSDTIRYKRQ